MNFEKQPTGDGARGLIQNITESERLHLHIRLRNQGKYGEVVKVGIVIPLVHFFQYFFATKINCQEEMERMDECKTVPNRHIFISIFG